VHEPRRGGGPGAQPGLQGPGGRGGMDRALAGDRPEIELEDVALHYGDFVAIESIGFAIPAGQFVALVGPTGCGKSSVLNLIAGLLAPTHGRVLAGAAAVAGVNRDAA